MDFYNFRLPLLFLAALGCCSGSGVIPKDNLNGVIGKNVTIETSVTSSPDFLTIGWSFNNDKGISSIVTLVPTSNTEDVEAAYVNRIVFNKTTYTLQLLSLVKEDEGEYSINIVNSNAKTLTGLINLKVLEPVSDVKISSNLPEAVEFNSTVVLTCSAKGSFTYQWMNGSVAVVADAAHFKLSETGDVLTINEVRRTDLRGPIHCIARNALETGKSAAFNLTVSYGPENIVMNKIPAESFLRKGSNLTLTCSAQSDPPAQLRWMFNGAELPQAPMQTQSSTFSISNLEDKHSGNYSCVAFNTKTMRYAASQVAMVSVLEALSGASISNQTSLLIAGNSTVNLTCTAATGKADTVEWFKDGKALTPDTRVTLSADKSILTISTVRKEDAGEYKCQLKNKVNTDEASYRMVINYGPENVKVNGKGAVKFEDTVEITCSADSVPPSTYTWKHNDTVVDISLANYRISKASLTDSGTYTCEARNPVTGMTMKQTHKLLVTEDGTTGNGLSGGAIAGIVIGVLVAVTIIGCIIVRKRKSADITSPY